MATQFAVLHVSKGKGGSTGLTHHIDREKTPPNADPEKAHLNEIDDYSHLGSTLGARADAVIKAQGVTRKVKADAVKYCPIILTGSHERMKELEAQGKLDQWKDENRAFIEKRYGKENLISFALHRDEKTPHIHAVVVPIIKDTDKKGNSRVRLSAKEKFGRLELKKLQDDYGKEMSKYGLARGVEGSKAKHQTVEQFYKALPEQIAEKERELSEKAKELAKMKVQYAQYSAGKGMKKAAEGVGDFLTGGKKKREARIEELEGQLSGLAEDYRKLQDKHEKTDKDLDRVIQANQGLGKDIEKWKEKAETLHKTRQSDMDGWANKALKIVNNTLKKHKLTQKEFGLIKKGEGYQVTFEKPQPVKDKSQEQNKGNDKKKDKGLGM